jgi:cytochrome c biogenesis protein CcdA
VADAVIPLPILVGGALVDSIAPCVIGVLILLLTILSKLKDKRGILTSGLIYIAGVYVTYFLGGIAILRLFELSREVFFFSSYLYMAMGGVIMAFGMLEMKDLFWYGRGVSLSIPARFIGFIESYVKKAAKSKPAAFMFGVVTTLIELPCTGAPYLAVLALMSFVALPVALPYLMLYNLVFIIPLVAVIYMIYTGTGLKRIEEWRKGNRKKARLLMGLFMIGLGAILIWVIRPDLVPYFVAGAGAIIGLMYAVWKLRNHS